MRNQVRVCKRMNKDFQRPKVMASGWESDGLGFEPWRLQATFDPGLPKKSNKNILSLIVYVPSMIDSARRTLKD